MNAKDWAVLISTILSIVALVAGGVKFLTKHYFAEIKAELKPNGGSSLKDQVNRLEESHQMVKSRLDEADQMRRDMNSKLDKMYMILIDHIAKNDK